MKADKKEEKYLKDLAKKIALLREQSGLSVQEFAEKLDLARMYVYQIESGKRVPGILVLRRIAKALKADMSVFFND